MKRINVFLAILLCCAVLLYGCTDNDNDMVFTPNVATVGVWWWHSDLGDEYLDFAAKNGVSEIYYSTSKFGQQQSDFIVAARNKNIQVYLLCGEYQWIDDDTGFRNLMQKYIDYQDAAAPDEKFAGVHLDVEPHQDPEFSENRTEILRKYLSFVIRACADFGELDFDIPFWFDDEVSYKNQTVPLYEAVISEANRVFVMSYRDTAQAMYDVGSEEVACAKALDKQIFLCAETYSAEADFVSYMHKGKEAMYDELNLLNDLADYQKLGVAIHHIKAWKTLKD